MGSAKQGSDKACDWHRRRQLAGYENDNPSPARERKRPPYRRPKTTTTTTTTKQRTGLAQDIKQRFNGASFEFLPGKAKRIVGILDEEGWGRGFGGGRVGGAHKRRRGEEDTAPRKERCRHDQCLTGAHSGTQTISVVRIKSLKQPENVVHLRWLCLFERGLEDWQSIRW